MMRALTGLSALLVVDKHAFETLALQETHVEDILKAILLGYRLVGNVRQGLRRCNIC